MNGARSRRLHSGLGESWGDAEYGSDGGASVDSMSEFESEEGVESDPGGLEGAATDARASEKDDIATPLPSRVTRASSKTSRDTPVQTPTKRISARQAQSPTASPLSQPRSLRSTPGSNSLEPSLIMPSMYGSTETFHNASPLHNSQLRSRKLRRSSGHTQPNSTHSSPRISSRRPSHRMPQDPEVRGNANFWYYLDLLSRHMLWPVLEYVLAVSGQVFEFLKPVFALGLVLCLFSLALSWTSGFLQTVARNTLSPICVLPGSSYILPFCANINVAYHGDEDPFEVDDLITVQSAFEDIVKASSDTSLLPQTITQSQNTIREIKSLVRFSKLPSKSELEVELGYFIELASEASSELIRYNQNILSTMDKLISTNKWTLRILEGLSDKAAGVGMIERMASALNPFSVLMAPPLTLHQQAFEQYLKHVSSAREDLNDLIQMAQGVLAILYNLDGRLDVIDDIAARDNVYVEANRDELLSQLWTILGGNGATRKDYDRQLKLLKQVTAYRREAVRLVSTTLAKAREIVTGLENLEERVSAPAVLGYREDVPLTYHIELVEKAVDRLESVMNPARGIDRDTQRALLRGPKAEKELPGRDDDGPTVSAKVKGGKGGKN